MHVPLASLRAVLQLLQLVPTLTVCAQVTAQVQAAVAGTSLAGGGQSTQALVDGAQYVHKLSSRDAAASLQRLQPAISLALCIVLNLALHQPAPPPMPHLPAHAHAPISHLSRQATVCRSLVVCHGALRCVGSPCLHLAAPLRSNSIMTIHDVEHRLVPCRMICALLRSGCCPSAEVAGLFDTLPMQTSGSPEQGHAD